MKTTMAKINMYKETPNVNSWLPMLKVKEWWTREVLFTFWPEFIIALDGEKTPLIFLLLLLLLNREKKKGYLDNTSVSMCSYDV